MSQLSRINKKNTRHKFKSQRAPFSAIIIHINNLIARSLSLYGTEPILCQTKKKRRKRGKRIAVLTIKIQKIKKKELAALRVLK